MAKLIEKYGYAPDKDAISHNLELIAANLEKVVTPEILKECFSTMDLTTLSTTDTVQSVGKLVAKVNAFPAKYPDFPLPASVCVYPNFTALVKEQKTDPLLHVTAVCSCFPTAQSFLEVKVKECELAVAAGADEIDIVLSLNKFLAGDLAGAGAEIAAMRAAIDAASAPLGKKVVLKVILETGILVSPENIAEASFLAMENGADFIKTSTGKVEVNATPMAAYIMCECIRLYYEKTGVKVGFKAAGGISSALDAVGYWSIVSTLLGKEWLDKSLFRLGVSRLANALLSAVEQKTVAFF